MTIARSEFTSNINNSPSQSGGAIDVSAANSVRITQSVFKDNATARYGGAITLNDTATIEYSAFVGNSALGGGGIVLGTGAENTIIRNSSFINNSRQRGRRRRRFA